MSLDLTLFQIEDGLRDLYAMREDASAEREDGAAYSELGLIDAAIQKYLEAELRKVDGTADFILMLDRLCHEQRERKGSVERCEIDREIDRLKARRESLRGVLAHVKDAVKFVMEGMSWREGKPKKLDGVRHSITLRGNGGAQPVEITDESLVPDEYCRVQVTMPLRAWKDICVAFNGDHEVLAQCNPAPREVSKSSVAEALNQDCARCDGNGVVEPWGELDEDADYRPGENPCKACGGSGKHGVPGARLAPRGESVIVK